MSPRGLIPLAVLAVLDGCTFITAEEHCRFTGACGDDTDPIGDPDETDTDVPPDSDTDLPETDTEVPPESDTEVPPETDTEVPPETDTEVPPETDTEVPPETDTEVPPETDTEVPPESDTEVPPETDTFVDTDTGPVGPSDHDHDGVPDRDDCAPLDSRIHPGAAEVCDGFDNDCDLRGDAYVLRVLDPVPAGSASTWQPAGGTPLTVTEVTSAFDATTAVHLAGTSCSGSPPCDRSKAYTFPSVPVQDLFLELDLRCGRSGTGNVSTWLGILMWTDAAKTALLTTDPPAPVRKAGCPADPGGPPGGLTTTAGTFVTDRIDLHALATALPDGSVGQLELLPAVVSASGATGWLELDELRLVVDVCGP